MIWRVWSLPRYTFRIVTRVVFCQVNVFALRTSSDSVLKIEVCTVVLPLLIEKPSVKESASKVRLAVPEATATMAGSSHRRLEGLCILEGKKKERRSPANCGTLTQYEGIQSIQTTKHTAGEHRDVKMGEKEGIDRETRVSVAQLLEKTNRKREREKYSYSRQRELSGQIPRILSWEDLTE